MKKPNLKSQLLIIMVLIVSAIPACKPDTEKPDTPISGDLTIWYDSPGESRGDALLLGNGSIGVMVFGHPQNERIALNHEWLWRDRKLRDRANPDVAHNLPEVRKLLLEGKIIEGSTAANNLLGSQRIPGDFGKPPFHTYGPDPFQPAGDLKIVFPDHDGIMNYRRQIDLTTGISSVSYESDGVNYTRKCFTSLSDNIMVLQISADQPGKISCEVNLSRIFDPECKIDPWASGSPVMEWTTSGSDSWTTGDQIGFVGEFVEGKTFAITATMTASGEKVRTSWNEGWPEFQVSGADDALILLSIATNYETEDPKAFTEGQINRVLQRHRDYSTIAAAHIAEYDKLFNRTKLSLGGPDRSQLPIDERIAEYKSGAYDPGLAALFFQYGRYILLSSSGTGGLPSNLRGIWGESLRPTWSSDFHHDINLQHYYWPAEVANLSECTQPLFDYLDRCIPAARIAAKNLYGCDGIFIPLTTGAWCRCLKTEPGGTDLSKERGGWDEWTGAAAWLSQHYWWHYEYHEDMEFLRTRAYPFLKEVAMFYEDFLIPDPREDSPFYGKLITVPSVSPENSFEGGVLPNSIGIGSTSDFEFIQDVLSHCIEASEILDIDENERKKWRTILNNLPPFQIGKHGQLQEWLEDYNEPEPSHRHVTHLYGIYTSDIFTIDDTPDLAAAARNSLERRLEHGGGGGLTPGTGIYARVREGDLAEKYLQEIYMNFRSTETPPAGCAQIAEMLMQSYGGKIRILPALPEKWPEGNVKGLLAQGGFVVDMEWKEGKLVKATIYSKNGGSCKLLANIPVKLEGIESSSSEGKNKVVEYDFQTKSGDKVQDYSYEFDTVAGGEYIILPEV